MKEIKTPANLNERIAFYLGFKKYFYQKDWDGNKIYSWDYLKGWITGGTPCLNIPNFIGMAVKWKELQEENFELGFASCYSPRGKENFEK